MEWTLISLVLDFLLPLLLLQLAFSLTTTRRGWPPSPHTARDGRSSLPAPTSLVTVSDPLLPLLQPLAEPIPGRTSARFPLDLTQKSVSAGDGPQVGAGRGLGKNSCGASEAENPSRCGAAWTRPFPLGASISSRSLS